METHLSGRFTNVVNASFTMKAVVSAHLPCQRLSVTQFATLLIELSMSQSPIDLAHLARQTGGDHDLERELLALFAQQCVRHLRTIHAGGDARTRIDAAHTLKGAAQAIGAWQVAEAADAIERQLAADDAGRTEHAMDALALAAAEARAAISKFELAA